MIINNAMEDRNTEKARLYTQLIPVVDGWAGAKTRVFTLFNSITLDQRTDQWTDGRTKPLKELHVRN